MTEVSLTIKSGEAAMVGKYAGYAVCDVLVSAAKKIASLPVGEKNVLILRDENGNVVGSAVVTLGHVEED